MLIINVYKNADKYFSSRLFLETLGTRNFLNRE